MIIDHAFTILAVLIACLAWKYTPSYRWIAMALVADFCIFTGIDELWINTAILDISQPEMHILKAFVYLSFFFIYLICGSLYLSILTVAAIAFHLANPVIEPAQYTPVMVIYCILQLSGAFIGVYYEPIRKRFPYLHRFDHYRTSHSR